ncbi:uncharacterized protein LOC111693147 [Anoplophora glabripennis]|uniref:uncharacterized protein LOC111693147 n=1 Tax=Anoplophora glabripennis TaxID=217634 RepID=UPI000C7591DA|nr:uncharacterized protein LOC111693147 [Anoplophora glabripennis]
MEDLAIPKVREVSKGQTRIVIGRSPFKAVFGTESKQGLKSTNLPRNMINSITTEEELQEMETVINSSVQENRNSQDKEEIVNENEIEPMKGDKKETSIKFQQDKCFDGQKRQAEQMISVTKKRLGNIEIGDCVLVNVDKVDRSPGDPPNLIAVIIDIKNDVYQVGTSGGIIKSWFNRLDLKKATSRFISIKQVNTSKFLSIREAVSLESLFKGQGYVKSSCQPSKVQCKSNRCQCFKAKIQCNSRCHKSGPCINK